MNAPSQPPRNFLSFLFEHLGATPKRKNSGLIAHIKQSDNPDTDWHAWETLVQFGVDIEYPARRLPYCIVGASLCRENRPHDGTYGLGAALRMCFEEQEPDSIRLRRLLACTSTEEACGVLRPVLSLIRSKAPGKLCYEKLLKQLLYFDTDQQQAIKATWAKDFWKILNTEKIDSTIGEDS